ncbi:MAG: OsmC family protein, partial [Bacteroidota bacterium]
FERKESPFVFEITNENGATALVDATPNIGGKNKGLTPMQLLAGSLAGCMSIDVISILNKQKIDPSYFAIEIQATKKEGQPSPFENIHLLFKVDTNVPKEKLEKAIILSKEKYCSVFFSLNPEIQVSYEIEVID